MDWAAVLVDWYSARRRALPWRRDRDPYRIWISEVMLQQTQVKTVIPYFEAFIKRFPSIQDLALASVEDVLSNWSGLGYYRRARQLHRAAQKVVSDGGELPSSSQDLQALPGIGAYTAAAIASIAFDEVIPVLDGNVERVLCRFLALEGNPKLSALRTRLFEAAELLLDRLRPGDSNQALMELGATVCQPKSPRCSVCPLREGCQAFKQGRPEAYPAPKKRRKSESIQLSVALAEEKGSFLLFRRPDESGVLPGMWELPSVARDAKMSKVEGDLKRRYGGVWRLKPSLFEVRHQISYRSLRMYVHPARCDARELVADGPKGAWIPLSRLKDFPTSSMVGKILARRPTGEPEESSLG